MKVLVCGSTEWKDWDSIRECLEEFGRGTIIVHGDARGADKMAGRIADDLGFKVQPFPANWNPRPGIYNPGAGFDRNIRMLDETEPDMVVAFQLNNSKGTQHTINEAHKRGIAVFIVAAHD